MLSRFQLPPLASLVRTGGAEHSFIDMFIAHGIRDVISTDVDVDGTLAGPSCALYTELIDRFPNINIIASGGVGSMKHLHELSAIGVHGVIVGKAIYEGRISLNEISALC